MVDRDEARRQELFAELIETGSTAARNELVESYAPLAECFANRYRRKTDDHEDLSQVAHLALVKAVDRFDPSFGVNFSTFAGRTIDGELKRYFRDRTWSVRVPRTLQEMAVEIRDLTETLTAENGRSPTVPELAERAGYDIDVIVQALDVQTARWAKSIDAPTNEGSEAATVGASIGEVDQRLDKAELRLTMQSLLDELDERDREIVELRFFGELTQQEIADRLGISQMHVSRLLRSAVGKLRSHYRG